MLGLIAVIVTGLCLMLLFAIAVGRFIAYGLDDDDQAGRGLPDATPAAAEPAPAAIYPIALARARRDRGSAA